MEIMNEIERRTFHEWDYSIIIFKEKKYVFKTLFNNW
jgi:hypothetical protein